MDLLTLSKIEENFICKMGYVRGWLMENSPTSLSETGIIEHFFEHEKYEDITPSYSVFVIKIGDFRWLKGNLFINEKLDMELLLRIDINKDVSISKKTDEQEPTGFFRRLFYNDIFKVRSAFLEKSSEMMMNSLIFPPCFFTCFYHPNTEAAKLFKRDYSILPLPLFKMKEKLNYEQYREEVLNIAKNINQEHFGHSYFIDYSYRTLNERVKGEDPRDWIKGFFFLIGGEPDEEVAFRINWDKEGKFLQDQTN